MRGGIPWAICTTRPPEPGDTPTAKGEPMLKLSIETARGWTAAVYVTGLAFDPRPCITISDRPAPLAPNVDLDAVDAVLSEAQGYFPDMTGYRLEQGEFLREVAA